MKINKAIFFALLCVISWSMIPVISKITTSDITPLQLLFLSNVFSSLMIGCLLVFWRKNIINISSQIRNNLWITSFPGFLGCFFYYLCLYYGYSKANGITVDLQNLSVLWIVFIGALAFALFSLLSKKIVCHSLIATFLFFIWGTLFSLVTLLATTGIQFPSSSEAWIGLIINGVIVNGISYFWWLRALQLEDGSRIASLVFFTPILASIWLVIFLKKPFFISYLVGLLLCISSGILTLQRSKD